MLSHEYVESLTDVQFPEGHAFFYERMISHWRFPFVQLPVNGALQRR